MLYEKINLWNKGEYDEERPQSEMAVFSLKGRKKRPAVVIFPGGGYHHHAPGEGESVAMQFLANGYQAFIVKYTVMPQNYQEPLRDATRAMCLIRDNCEKWRVDPDQIAVIGFSAGGHLASSLATLYDADFLQDIPGMEKGKNRPNLLISCYSVLSAKEGVRHNGSFDLLFNGDESQYDKLSIEKKVHENMPPVFIWHTFSDDGVSVNNSLLFASALKEKRIPFELHIYPKGPHGLSLAKGESQIYNDDLKHISSWMPLCLDWMKIYFTLSEYDDGDYRGGAIYPDEV